MEFEGEMTEERYIDMTLEAEAAQPEDGFEVHSKAIMVDISGRDVTHFDNVDKALGLTRSTEVPYESICAKVKPIDEGRDKKMMESGFIEAFTEILVRAEAEASWPKQCPLVKKSTFLRQPPGEQCFERY